MFTFWVYTSIRSPCKEEVGKIREGRYTSIQRIKETTIRAYGNVGTHNVSVGRPSQSSKQSSRNVERNIEACRKEEDRVGDTYQIRNAEAALANSSIASSSELSNSMICVSNSSSSSSPSVFSLTNSSSTQPYLSPAEGKSAPKI